MSNKKLNLRWKKEAEETGLRAVGAGPRSHFIMATIDGERDSIASVHAIKPEGQPFVFNWVAYKWSIFSNEALGLKRGISKKTYPLTDEGLSQAKEDCFNYVAKKLGI